MSRAQDPNAAPDFVLSAPRFAAGWALLVYVLAAMTLAYPALTGAWLVAPHSDQYIAGYAFREFAAQSLRSGAGFPQWNPYLFGGMPYIAAMHGDIFYPTFLLRMLMPTDQAMTWSFVIHIVLAGFFTFGFLRSYGVGFYGSLVGGLAYMLSGPIAAYASPGHDGKLFVSALFPLALWLLVRGVRDGHMWAWGAFAITIGLAVLSPHPQLLQYMLLASGSFALFLAFSGAGGSKLPRDVALKRLGLALGAVALGFLIGAIQYLPVREYVAWSPRAGGKGYDHAVSYSLPLEELFNTVVPQFSGILEKYWGRNQIHFHSEYPGVVVMVLAGAGMFAGGVQRKGFRWFWLGTFVVSLLWALGGSTPFYQIIYYLVPGTKYFRAPSTMMFVTMFALAVFAALGTERIINAAAAIPKRFLWGWAAAIVALALFFAAGLPESVARSVADYRAAAYPPEQQGQIAEYVTSRANVNQPDVIVGSLRSIAFVLVALGVIWAAARARLSRTQVAWALAAVVAADLWSIEHQYWIFSPRASAVYATDPAIEAIRQSPTPARAITWDPLQTAAFRDPAFYDALMSHGIRLSEGYHGNELGRYQQLVDAAASRNPLPRPIPLDPTFLSHENLRYLYTTLPDTLMPQVQAALRWPTPSRRVVGPVRNAAGSTIYLYELPGDNRAAWVASVMVKGADDQALATVLDARFDPTRAAIVDTGAAVQAAQPTTVPPPSAVQARVTRLEPGDIEVQLDKPAAAGSALVVSENFFPGWSASVDGKTAQTVRANYNLIGVPLSAGARQVTLRFRDPVYGAGKTITFLAVALALLSVGAGFFAERRRVANVPVPPASPAARPPRAVVAS